MVGSVIARYIDEEVFFAGLLSALKLKGISSIDRGERFDRAVLVTYDALRPVANKENVRVDFKIRPNPIHGSSRTVETAIATAAAEGLISLDNPTFHPIRLRLSDDLATRQLASMPISSDSFDELADRFIDAYESV